jgi:hypothetical protein
MSYPLKLLGHPGQGIFYSSHSQKGEGRYHEGGGSIIEVADAQTPTLYAPRAHIQALYDYCTTLARLDRAAGEE